MSLTTNLDVYLKSLIEVVESLPSHDMQWDVDLLSGESITSWNSYTWKLLFKYIWLISTSHTYRTVGNLISSQKTTPTLELRFSLFIRKFARNEKSQSKDVEIWFHWKHLVFAKKISS
jgi:hypothetical protein